MAHENPNVGKRSSMASLGLSLSPEPRQPFLKLRVQLPVVVQGSPLDFIFAQKKLQGCGDSVRTLAKSSCEVALADDHLPGWVALMDIVPVARNPVGEDAKFPLLLTLRTLRFGLFAFEKTSAHCCNSDRTNNRRADSPVRGEPRGGADEGVHHLRRTSKPRITYVVRAAKLEVLLPPGIQCEVVQAERPTLRPRDPEARHH